MLSIYRRHRKGCPHAALRDSKKCRCSLWLTGTLAGVPYRKAAKTRSWEAAERIRRQLEDGKRPETPSLTFKEASQRFINELQSQNRAPDTIRKYRLLFDELLPFGAQLGDFTFDTLIKFRSTWKGKPATNNKRLDRLKAAFRFFHDAGWISSNPAKLLKPASVREPMVKPFSKTEQQFLLSKPVTRLLRCFVHTLFYSGLRISDVCMLKPHDFDGNCIRRVNQKNQETVLVPLPPALKAELDQLPLSGGYYFLRGQSEKHYTQSDAWRSILNDAFKSKIPDFHPHRFRHTAAVNWLLAGLSLEEVSALLGNSTKVAEKHYASFCPDRQENLVKKLEKAWKPALVRVK